jgi:hypothetical protein
MLVPILSFVTAEGKTLIGIRYLGKDDPDKA